MKPYLWMALLAWTVPALAQVVAPPPAQREIWLKMLHPGAAKNPVFSKRVEKLDLAAVRKIIAQKRPSGGNAAMECLGGYNPVTKAPLGTSLDYMGFDLASDRGEGDLFKALPNTATAHDVCMAKARELLTRQAKP